jgi:uncharacterized membrane protein
LTPTTTARRAALTFPRATLALVLATLLVGAIAPAAMAANGLELTTPYPAVVVAPGSKVSFDLAVASTRAANVGLEVKGVPTGWTASLHGGGFVVDGISVTSGKDGTVRLDVTVPGDAADGSHNLIVTATDGGVASDNLAITVRVAAGAAGDITMTTASPTLTGASDATFSFPLTLQNDSAQDVTVSATATGPSPDWTVSAKLTGSEQAASTIVKAGSSTGINVSVTAPTNAPAGQYPIHVTATAGSKNIEADLGIEITGTYKLTLSTPGDLLSAHGSAGSGTQQQFTITNTGTAELTDVKLTEQAPTGWDVTFDKDTIASIAPQTTASIVATIKPSGEAVAGDYVVTVSAANDKVTASAQGTSAQIRFTVETSPIWAIVGIGVIALILAGLFYVFRTYGRR